MENEKVAAEKKRKKRKGKSGRTVIVLIVVLAALLGGFFLYKKKTSSQKSQGDQSVSTATEADGHQFRAHGVQLPVTEGHLRGDIPGGRRGHRGEL